MARRAAASASSSRPLGVQHQRQFAVRLGEFGPRRDRPAIGVGGLGVAVPLAMRDAQVEMRVGVVRHLGDGLFDQAYADLGVAALQLDDAEQLQDFGVAWRCRENIAVKARRGVPSPGKVVPLGLLKRRLAVGVVGVRPLVAAHGWPGRWTRCRPAA